MDPVSLDLLIRYHESPPFKAVANRLMPNADPTEVMGTGSERRSRAVCIMNIAAVMISPPSARLVMYSTFWWP